VKILRRLHSGGVSTIDVLNIVHRWRR